MWKKIYWLCLCGFLSICVVMIAVKCVKRTSGNIKVYGHITDYTYYDRRLSVSDFEQFDHNSTYRDIVDRIGLENGTIGSGILRSYYELEDGRFVICGVWGNGLYFSVVNHEDHEYYLLPPIYNVIDYCSQTQAVYDHLWNCSYPINELLHSFLDLFTGVKKYVVYY